MIVRMAGAKHPLIAADGPHAFTHLVGQRLKGKAMIRGGECARNRVVHTLSFHGGQKFGDRFRKTALQQIFVAVERHEPFWVDSLLEREMKTMDRVEKE